MQLVSWLRHNCSHFYIFSNRVHVHIELVRPSMLQNETPVFILTTLWSSNSLNVNPVDYKIWSVMQKMIYRMRIRYQWASLADFGQVRWIKFACHWCIHRAMVSTSLRLHGADGEHFMRQLWFYQIFAQT